MPAFTYKLGHTKDGETHVGILEHKELSVASDEEAILLAEASVADRAANPQGEVLATLKDHGGHLIWSKLMHG
jgi:hypothetical protein